VPRTYTIRAEPEEALGEKVYGLTIFSCEAVGVVNKAGLQAHTRNEHTWVMDSGASLHCTPYRNMLQDFKEYSLGERAIVQADGKEGKGPEVLGEGQVYLHTVGVGAQAGSSPRLMLRRVLWVPRLAANLLSVAKAVDSGAKVIELSSERFSLTREGEAMVVGRRQHTNAGGLWAISSKHTYKYPKRKAEKELGKLHKQELMQAQPAVVQRSKADTMHRRMGHLGYQNLEKLVSMAEGLGVNEKEVKEASKVVCEECQEGKQVAQPFESGIPRQQPGSESPARACTY
jgi:hypothetical protein